LQNWHTKKIKLSFILGNIDVAGADQIGSSFMQLDFSLNGVVTDKKSSWILIY